MSTIISAPMFAMFQCSSASRKFLNMNGITAGEVFTVVSVLFSEPKIPQSFHCGERFMKEHNVSVLFSEPKIPQYSRWLSRRGTPLRFSALQRAENSSIHTGDKPTSANPTFQCSSASRKFLNRGYLTRRLHYLYRFQCSSASRKFLNRAVVM